MILMRVGEHQPRKILALVDEIADIGQNQIDTGQLVVSRKRHAEINRKPGAMLRVTHPVNRQVHADLANAAQRGKHQFLRRGHGQRPPKPKTSPAVTAVTVAGLLEQQSSRVVEP